MSKLTLVGTVHLDPEGYERTVLLLEAQKPGILTVEVSPYALKFRNGTGKKYQQLLEAFRRKDGTLPNGLAAVAAQLEIPFEYRAAAAYAKINHAKVHRIGDSGESRRLLDLLEREMMATDNLVALALRSEPPLSDLVKNEWARARNHYQEELTIGSDAMRRLVRRNGRMARKIRPLVGKDSVLHIGGWEHLKGLSELLADLKPKVLLLNP